MATVFPPPGIKVLEFIDTIIGKKRQELVEGDTKDIKLEGGKQDFLARYFEIRDLRPDLPAR